MAQPELRVEHLKPMPFMEVPAFFAKLQRVNGVDRILALCLMWHILTASRPEESRGILWTEIDFDNDRVEPAVHPDEVQGRPLCAALRGGMDILEKRIAAGGMARDKLIFPNPLGAKRIRVRKITIRRSMAKILEIPDSVPKKDRYNPHAFPLFLYGCRVRKHGTRAALLCMIRRRRLGVGARWSATRRGRLMPTTIWSRSAGG